MKIVIVIVAIIVYLVFMFMIYALCVTASNADDIANKIDYTASKINNTATNTTTLDDTSNNR